MMLKPRVWGAVLLVGAKTGFVDRSNRSGDECKEFYTASEDVDLYILLYCSSLPVFLNPLDG